MEDTASFVSSIGANGTRNTCNAGCRVVGYFELAPARFAARRVTGAKLVNLIRGHEAQLRAGATKNTTLRLALAQWWVAHGLAPELNEADPIEASNARIAFATRLRDVVRQTLPLPPPPAPVGAHLHSRV